MIVKILVNRKRSSLVRLNIIDEWKKKFYEIEI
jgi:hypothetical protein